MVHFKHIRSICSTNKFFNVHSKDLEKRFRERGYPIDWIQPAFEKCCGCSQIDCLPTKRQNDREHISCPVQYSPLGRQFERVIRKHWYILSSDPALGKSFSASLCIVYKRPPNSKNLLVRSYLHQPTPSHFLNEIPDGNYKCGRCAQCSFTYKCHTFNHPVTGKPFKIKGIICLYHTQLLRPSTASSSALHQKVWCTHPLECFAGMQIF